MEIVTKVVPIRAVELSIGAFCTEFRCEQLCDNGIFWDRGRELDHPDLKYEISYCKGLKVASKIMAGSGPKDKVFYW